MRIMITGASGQLGTDLVDVLSEHELYPVDIEELDITDYTDVVRQVTGFEPDIVIHAAAYTDVDGCELNPDRAYQVNAIGTQNLALACQRADAAMLYVSTDFVFDGSKQAPYLEFDDPNPLSVYGRSKLAGERYVTSLLHRHYVCRTAWLYGWYGANFVKTVLRLAEEQTELKIVNDQFGSPTFSRDLARKLGAITVSGQYGIYHTVNEGSCSWFEFAREILKLAGKSEVKVKPIATEKLGRPAPRPAYSVLRNFSLEMRGFAPFRPWREALEEYFSPHA